MKSLQKAGVLSAATSLAAGVMFVGAASSASAAPVTITADTLNIAPGGFADVTIDGCEVGGIISVQAPELFGEGVADSFVVEEGWAPATETFPYELAFDDSGVQLFTELTLAVTCAAAGDPEAVVSTAELTLNFYGESWLEADPVEFVTGEDVTITVGDFLPGETVAIEVYPVGSEELVFTENLGTAAEDFSVTGTVVFPADLQCGDYDVVIGSETTAVVEVELDICAAAEETPTPTPLPTVAPTVTPTPTVIPTATAAPTSRPQPGLPSTGN